MERARNKWLSNQAWPSSVRFGTNERMNELTAADTIFYLVKVTGDSVQNYTKLEMSNAQRENNFVGHARARDSGRTLATASATNVALARTPNSPIPLNRNGKKYEFTQQWNERIRNYNSNWIKFIYLMCILNGMDDDGAIRCR